jgi:hypothetical protein
MWLNCLKEGSRNLKEEALIVSSIRWRGNDTRPRDQHPDTPTSRHADIDIGFSKSSSYSGGCQMLLGPFTVASSSYDEFWISAATSCDVGILIALIRTPSRVAALP